MRHIFIILLLGISSVASGTTYYVSSSTGADTNSGTSTATPWKTLNQVNNFGSFAGGDVILFKRGDTWNESLVPPTSGTAGSPIAFDAYGFGGAPVFTAAIGSLPGTGWTTVTGTVQKTDLTNYGLAAPSISNPTVNYVEFGNLYGRKQPAGSGCSGAIVSKYDWCLLWPYLYVFSTTNNPVTYYGVDTPIVPVFSQSAGLNLIYVNGKSWLTFQHIKLQNFDYMGVGVAGAADNLVFANMESDGMIPAGTTPLGFYVNATNPASIQFLNDDAQMNYDGFRVDSTGSATAITVVNCRGYANRDAGLKDNTPGANHVPYSYSHFYGNNVAQLIAGDVVGGIAGSGNVPSSIAPVVTNFGTYPL